MIRSIRTTCVRLAAVLLSAVFSIAAQTQQLPNAAGKDTVQRICGACHTPTIVLGRGMSREAWSEVVSSMISRGAKGTPAEFAEIVDYLATNLPADQSASSTTSPGQGGRAGSPRPVNNRQVIDPAAASRGKVLYLKECATCHGPLARGGETGPDLVRSVTLLHDRYGDTLGPFLREKHQVPGGQPFSGLSKDQVTELSHFLHQQVNDTLRSGPYTKVLNVLTGDPQAGAAYFNTSGRCVQCHSATGDLAGIASRYDPPTLQQRFLFPRAIGFSRSGLTPLKPVTITVSAPDGHSVSGTLVHMDDFTVSLRDGAGDYHSWKRTPQLNIEKHDPYAAHDELLEHYTDKDIHNVVAYLETLK